VTDRGQAPHASATDDLSSRNFIKVDPYTFRQEDQRKRKAAIMTSDVLRHKVIDRLKQSGYYYPREVEKSDELRQQEELRVVKSIEDLELTAHEVVRSQMAHIIKNLFVQQRRR